MIISDKICSTPVEKIILARIDRMYSYSNSDSFPQISDYCDILLEANPSNIYATLYRALVNQSTLPDDVDKYPSVIKAAENCTALAKDILKESEEYYDFVENAMTMVGPKLTNYIGSLYVNYRYVRRQYEQDPTIDQSVLRTSCSDLSRKITSAMSNATNKLADYYCEWMENANPETTPKKLVEIVGEVIDGLQSQIDSTRSEGWYINTSALKSADDECEELLEKIHILAVAKYWEAHPEEKAAIENTIKQLEKDITAFEAEGEAAQQDIKDRIEDESKKLEHLEQEFDASKDEILKEIQELEEEKSKQGLFALGAKKDLKNRIAERQEDIYTLEREHSDKVDSIEERISNIRERGRAVSKEFSAKIADIRVQIDKNRSILENKEQ